MKMISIPEDEYKGLQEENNSLRELINQFVGKATKLVPRKRGANELPPKIRAIAKVTKMTKQQQIEHFKTKFK